MGKPPRESEEQSLIPVIQETEHGCRLMLEQARAQAEEEVRAAEREAGEALQRAREEIPERMERRHGEEVARLQAGGRPLRGEPAELAHRGERNLEKAVAAVMERVWPEQAR
jgi:hypothetical protein